MPHPSTGNAGAGVNSLTIGASDHLLVEVGERIHLAVEAAAGEDHRPAVFEESLDPTSPSYAVSAVLYNQAVLLEPRWRPTTLCGREWSVMAAGEPGPIYEWQTAQLTPTCRACLHSIDRLFPPVPSDDRIRLLA